MSRHHYIKETFFSPIAQVHQLPDAIKSLETSFMGLVAAVQSCSQVRLCNPMNCSMPGLPVHHHLLELPQTHVHGVGDAIQPSHPLLAHSPLPSILPSIWVFSNVSSSHQVAKVLEIQLQHQSFQ